MVRAPSVIVARPLCDADREAIATWRYPGALAIYDPGPDAFALREPEHFAVGRADGELIGYATLGEQARVPGGAYELTPSVVDIGMGLRPDLVGEGLGATALLVVIEEAWRRLSPSRIRATVAAANGRATALVTHLGFQQSHRFHRSSDGREFLQYERDTILDNPSRRTLSAVRPDRRPILAGLLDEYLGELSSHRERAVGAESAREYRYLDAYFGEPGRHAFLMLVGARVAGFALIRGPESTGAAWHVAEFFERPQHRTAGLGRWAITSIWRRFPGKWELQVHGANAEAISFWTRCVRAVSKTEPDVSRFEADDGERLQFEFCVAPPPDGGP